MTSAPITVAFLGPQGTFTEQALQNFISAGVFPPVAQVNAVAVDSPRKAIDMVRRAEADYACVAMESSVDGSVTQTEDALIAGDTVQIFQETCVPVVFSIMATPGATLEQIRTISCHPVAFAQIRGWAEHHIPQAQFLPASSNGAAALAVAEGEVDAAAAPARAAQLHGLTCLAENVADTLGAFTRFVLVGLPDVPAAATGRDRTSIALTLRNKPASLQEALTELSIRGVDLSRIGSRPFHGAQGGRMGLYVFHIDLVGHIEDEAVAEALAALYRRADEVRFLGSWAVGGVPAGESGDRTRNEGSAPPSMRESKRWVEGLKNRETQ